MFDKYGEFNSAEELNLAAEGFAGEGDTEALYGLAMENGIDREEADDYLEGYRTELATEYEAAVGRLKVQKNEAPEILISFALNLCGESKSFCAGVMAKGKRVRKAFDALKDAARKEARKRISRGETVVAVCETDREKEKLLTSYFLKTDEEFRQDLEKIIGEGIYESV